MKVFGSSGCGRITIPLATSAWKIGDMLGSNKHRNVAVATFTLHDSESVDIRRCFNETNHLFSFGRDVMKSGVSVDLILFLGKVCAGTTNLGGASSGEPKGTGTDLTLNALRDLYSKNRVSKKTKGLSSVIGSFAFNGYLVDMTIGSVDSRTQSCIVTLSFITIQEG